MDVFAQFLDERDKDCDWRPVNLPREERLQKFDDWLYLKLRQRIDWSWAGDSVAQGRRIGQARLYLERLVLNLWRRGWLLDGSKLAARILAPLDAIAKYQKAGSINEFWPYFCATIDRYVGVNAEEIQRESLQIGASIGHLLGPLGLNKPQKGPTLPELLAARASEVSEHQSTLREKQSLLRAKKAQIQAEDDRQGILL